MNAPITTIRSRYVALPAPNIDTDRIIPARFLTTITRDGLGQYAFHDWRYRADGTRDPACPLNAVDAANARILVTGPNFGCGSSREHAVWALLDAGFLAVVSAAFADIFRANAIGNGLIPVQVGEDAVAALVDGAQLGRTSEVTVDVATRQLTLPSGGVVEFPLAPFARHCLLNGIDELDYLRAAATEIDLYERAHAPTRQAT